MLKYLTLGLSSLIAAISFYRKNRDIFDAMARDLERRTETELALRQENSNLKTQEQGLTEQNRQLQDSMKSMDSCPCPPCQLARKYPKYGYIHRVRKAVNRGDHVA
jgi:hypothetical protein